MTTTLPPPPRVPRWVRVLLVVVGVGLLVAGAALAWFLSLLVTLAQAVVTDDRVQPHDEHVVAARQVAERDLAADLGGLLQDRPEQVLARTSLSECEHGQDNWKVKEDFDLACTQGDAVLLHGEPERLHDDLLALHEQLLAQGWAPQPGQVDAQPGLEGIPSVLAAREAGPAGASPGHPSGAGYVRGGTRLTVAWVDRGDEVVLGHPFRAAEWDVPRRADVETARLGELVPTDAHGLALVLRTEYFRA